MGSALISFLGGTAFRWLMGEFVGWLKARDEHKTEIERLRLQHEHDRERAQWQREAMAAAASEGLRVIEAQTVASAARAADDAFLAGIAGVNAASQRTDWIGAWNASIRPLLATIAIILLTAQAVAPQWVTLTALATDLIAAVLGIFVGERIRQRGA